MPNRVNFFEVTSVRLPAELGLRHKVQKPPANYSPKKRAQWRPKHDDYTLVYDIFRSKKPHHLTAICANPRNITGGLSLLSVRVNQVEANFEETVHRVVNRDLSPYICEVSIPIPSDAPADAPLELEFAWGHDGRTLFSARKTVARKTGALPDDRFTLLTLQKDNPPQWIVDWCRFHHLTHGVERIILYDNDSENRAELMRALEAIKEPIDIVLVDWPFPYGEHNNDLSCQIAAINHCNRCFGKSEKAVFLSSDVDIYMYTDSKHGLKGTMNALSQPGLMANLRRAFWLYWMLGPHLRRATRKGLIPLGRHLVSISFIKKLIWPWYWLFRKSAGVILCRGYHMLTKLPNDFPQDALPRFADFHWRGASKIMPNTFSLYLPSRIQYAQPHFLRPHLNMVTFKDTRSKIYHYNGLRLAWKGAAGSTRDEPQGFLDTTVIDAARANKVL